MRYQSWFRSMSEQKKRGSKIFGCLSFLCTVILLCLPSMTVQAGSAFEVEYSQISIGFAAQNNYQPESAFGHVFLIFHQDTVGPNALVLEFVGRVDGFTDAVRTLIDEVPGHYLLQTFAEKRRQYDLEDRGLYVANLRLGHEEVQALALEVQNRIGKTYPYDFAKRNCAYYMADLLTMIDPQMNEVKRQRIVQPVDVMKSAMGARDLDIVFSASSRELYLHSQKRLLQEDQERFELFLKGHLPVSYGDDLRNAVAAFLRYRIPREAETWRRQNYAHAQKYVYLSDEKVGDSPAFDEGTEGHFEVGIGSEKMVFAYRPQQENFYSQTPSSNSYAYLDLFSAEITLEARDVWLSSLNILASKSMNLEQGTARLLELGYRDWRGVTAKAEKEAVATFGVGLSKGRERNFFSFVPLMALAVGSNKKTEAEIRFGAEVVGEIRTSSGSLGLDVRQWSGSRLGPSRTYKLKAKYPVSKNINVGYEGLWVPDKPVGQHQIKMIYSVR